MTETAAPTFTDNSAQDTELASVEAQIWIEAVTGRTFSASFRESLEDGVILCELMNKIAPGSIRRINTLKSTIAHLDNVQQFLTACQDLGLHDAQLFDKFDLQDARGVRGEGVKRNEADRRIRSVCVTLYWLGRAVAELEDYSGPHLDLDAFRSILDGTFNFSESPFSEQETFEAEPREPVRAVENGYNLTFEEEQTADQLMEDIQNAVDELLLDFQLSPAVDKTDSNTPMASTKLGVSLHMNSRNGGFGFQVVGGAETGISAQVELVLPGSAAEEAGVVAGDELVSVNKQDVSILTHQQLVGVIKRCGSEGSIVLGLIRTVSQPRKTPSHTGYAPNQTAPGEPPEPSSSSSSLPAKRKRKKSKTSPPSSPPPPPPAEDSTTASEQQQQQQQPQRPANIPSPIDWEKEEKELERQAQAQAMMSPKRNQVPEVTEIDIRQPLATVIEEEPLNDEFAEFLESIPPPLSPSPSPATPPPPTATYETDVQRQEMERELQELVELTTASELKQLELEIQAEKIMKQENERALREAEEKAKIKSPEMPTPPSPKSPQVVNSDKPVPNRGRSSMDVEFDDLLQFAGVESPFKPVPEEPPVSTTPEETSPTLSFETPPLPMPTSEPPKRQTTKKTAEPPPVKPKPKKKSQWPEKDIDIPAPTAMNGLADDIQKELKISSRPAPAGSYTNSTVRARSTSPTTPTFMMVADGLKNIRPVTSEEAAEMLGDIKIHRVQRTRWTPKGGSEEPEVLSPFQITEEQVRHFRRHHEHLNTTTTPTSSRPVSEPMMQPMFMQSSFPEFDSLKTKPSPPQGRSVTLPRGYGSATHHNNSNQAYTSQPYSPPREKAGGLPRKSPPRPHSWKAPERTQDDWRARQQHEEETRRRQQEWKSHEELRSNHQVFKQALAQNQRNEQWKSQEENTHTGVSTHNNGGNGSSSSSDWRTDRSQTWSNRSRVKDGPHAAYAVKANGELCSRCHKTLAGAVLSVPALKMQFHLQCFTCRVCRAALSRGVQNTTVMVKNMQIHCRFCLSSDKGVLTSEC